ncbi:MAG: phosphopantothenoylcysteine decarboxylase [Phycisphaerales bacterium]
MPDQRPRLLVTAGPTHEPIDAVRYIANRSSGRVGVEIARAALRSGWEVTLALGPTPLITRGTGHRLDRDDLRRYADSRETVPTHPIPNH